ncbi:hypothetical protein ACSBR2_023977 [Camellia fascicularis]
MPALHARGITSYCTSVELRIMDTDIDADTDIDTDTRYSDFKKVNMLRERSKRYGTIKFVDISSDEYSPKENRDLDYKTVMGRIHAILSNGTVVTDVEAFRRLYEAVDLGWIYAITKYEPFATIVDALYGVWAKYRLQITGRPPLEEVLEVRKKKGEACNDSKVCKM